MSQRIAVIGAGISGIAAAWELAKTDAVTLFESEPRLGGHTDTHNVSIDDKVVAVDSGFIVFNRTNYPQFSAWLDELGVESRPTGMSFSVRSGRDRYEYGTTSLNALFPSLDLALSPSHWRMLFDIRRFYRETREMRGEWSTAPLGEYLKKAGYSSRFVNGHLGPMCAALWSTDDGGALDIPFAHVAAFMDNHRMLQLDRRPEWRVVKDGSARYLDAFVDRFAGEIRTATRAERIVRAPGRVEVHTAAGQESFDAIVLACHADTALALLEAPRQSEVEVLGAFRYSVNRAVVHSDPSFMPRDRKTWSSWNVVADDREAQRSAVTYWMNRLQGLAGRDFFVTLNPAVDPADIWVERSYEHPIFDAAARAAQSRREEINGHAQTFFCGAYWGWGFHEDGFASGTAAATQIREQLRAAA